MDVKKKIMILVSLCLVILVAGCATDKVLSKSYFNAISFDEIIDKIENKEDFVVVISQTTCSHCASYKPKVEDIANEHKVDIYYIDVDLLTEEENNEFKSYINFSSTPTTVFIKNGEEVTAANRINGDASREKIEKKLKNNGFID